jgi:predicted RNase H-like nuclease (RuvC/YqgF family)
MIDPKSIMEMSGESASVAAGWIVGALISLGFVVQKLLKNWNETSAGNMLIVNLREEIDRLSKQNIAIGTLLQAHQMDLIRLQKTASEREMRIDTLEREVYRLRSLVPNQYSDIPLS